MNAVSRTAASPGHPAAKDETSDELGDKKGPPLVSLDSAIFKDVHVVLKARLGQASLSVEALLALKAGSIVKLDAKLNDAIELRLNESVVARGEIVAVGDNFGVRIVDIAQAS